MPKILAVLFLGSVGSYELSVWFEDCQYFFRQYSRQFGISKTSANDIFHYWLKILREILPASLLEQLRSQTSDREVVQELLTEFELLVDSTEQSGERPGEYKEQKKFYSGKKKKHTFKNQFIILPQVRDIVDVIVGLPGPASDINLRSSSTEKF